MSEDQSFPKITFVMPAYNAEKYIANAILSIINQTVNNWELIIVDDVSTDHTFALAKSFQNDDSRIRVLQLDYPSGSAYEPRKKAIMEATTEWVAPLDADDTIDPDYLEKMIEVIMKTNASAVYPTLVSLDQYSKILTPKNPSLYDTAFKGMDCIIHTLNGWKINLNGGLIKRSYYLENFVKTDKFAKKSSYADEVLGRYLLGFFPEVAFSKARYNYRPNDESITNKKSIKLFHHLLNNIHLSHFIKTHFGEDSLENRMMQVQNFHGIIDALRVLNRYRFKNSNGKFSEKEKKEAFKFISQAMKIIDRNLIKPHVSPYYFFILNIGPAFARNCLMISDKINSKLGP